METYDYGCMVVVIYKGFVPTDSYNDSLYSCKFIVNIEVIHMNEIQKRIIEVLNSRPNRYHTFRFISYILNDISRKDLENNLSDLVDNGEKIIIMNVIDENEEI